MSRKSAAALRLEVESALAGRVVAPFQYRERQITETASAGIAVIDALTNGLPRGALTEVFGPPGSGKTTLLTAILASRTLAGELCALIDGRDTFDPASAQAAGILLNRLLWIRCREIEQVLRATDLLLQGGGFGVIAVDFSDFAPRVIRHIQLNVWFRWRRAVENTRTILLALEQEPNAKTCASLVLSMHGETACWSQTAADGCHTEAHLFESLQNRVERLRSKKKEFLMRRLDAQLDAPEDSTQFATQIVAKFGELLSQPPQQAKRKSVSPRP
jgi:recombination protein RecA